jgi:hypothetical protein
MNTKLNALVNAFGGNTGGLDPPWGAAPVAGGNFSVSGGQLTMSVPASTASSSMSLITYANSRYVYWDLTESYILVKLVSPGAQSAALELWVPQIVDSAGNWFGWHITNGQIQANYEGTVLASATYSATTHAWLRVRETAGTTYFDYSSDGLNWTSLTSYADSAHNYGPTAVYPNFYLGSNSSGTNPASSAVIDLLNLPPVPTQVPAYSVVNNLPAPVTSGTTVQSFIDVLGDMWIAKNGVNSGNWYRARDVCRARIWRTNNFTPVGSAWTIFPYDTVTDDAYGLCTTGTGAYFAAPVAGRYMVSSSYNIQIPASVTARAALDVYKGTTPTTRGTDNQITNGTTVNQFGPTVFGTVLILAADVGTANAQITCRYYTTITTTNPFGITASDLCFMDVQYIGTT